MLSALGVTLALSTYQAGKVILISARGGELTQLPRSFDKPMGLAVDGSRLAVATRREVVVLADAPCLAPAYAGSAGTYDALYLPRAVYFVGETDIHDLAWVGGDLLAACTRFSCLARIDDRHSFAPVWQPPFVTDLTPDDRCHLNGFAVSPTGIAYATALGRGDSAFGWRAEKATGGVLLSVPDGEVVLSGLCMPHSPRLIDGELFVLNAGAGEVLKVDPVAGRSEVIARLPGFLRGVAVVGDLMFIGLSRLRDGRSFGGLPLETAGDPDALVCGVAAINHRSGRVLGMLRYTADVHEIYDVAVLPGRVRPGILGIADDRHRSGLSMPDQGFWGSPETGEEARGL